MKKPILQKSSFIIEDGSKEFFYYKLEHPLIDQPLPSDFDKNEESEHLSMLWHSVPELQKYLFEEFVHAGGTGIVFKVTLPNESIPQALKIVRARLAKLETEDENVARTLSPVPSRELLALSKISHPNVIRLLAAIEFERQVIAISTTYVEEAKPLDHFLRYSIQKPGRKKIIEAYSAKRLEDACQFLVERFKEIASAIAHMHSLGIYHFDIKPANILLSKAHKALLTDLGSCVLSDELRSNDELRVHFTWTYAHPQLTEMISSPRGISGGGVKASSKLKVNQEIQKYDLFAFGRTLQEVLAVLAEEFGEGSYASYGFRFLHIIACLLLDGKNAPAPPIQISSDFNKRRFVDDVALGYGTSLFEKKKIKTAAELVRKLDRYSRQFSWYGEVPELDPYQPNTINTGDGHSAPFTNRIAKVLNHPAVRRLKSELQLGWIKEVYPGATHDRWAHTIGVLASTVRYYNALLLDPDVPTLRILLEPKDITYAIVAAILHDVGQATFAHDVEEACPTLYQHEQAIEDILNDKYWGDESLGDVIVQAWDNIELKRVISILKAHLNQSIEEPVDGLAADILDGPIDADKFDYLVRDGVSCGVTYGRGIDQQRFLQALTVDSRNTSHGVRLILAYKTKGSPAIESLLVARYQMFGAVYWHHTFRCIQAMFTHAVTSTFGKQSTLEKLNIPIETLSKLFYHYVVCGKPMSVCGELMKGSEIPGIFYKDRSSLFDDEKALEFVWVFADDPIKRLIERLAKRKLYKRIYEVKLYELGLHSDYSAVKSELDPNKRFSFAESLEKVFLNSVHKEIIERSSTSTPSMGTIEGKRKLDEIMKKQIPHILVDFTTRGVPEERNFPGELTDPTRKYLAEGRRQVSARVFHTVRQLQADNASVRVFASPELHELIVRFMKPAQIRNCIETTIPRLMISE